jgi:hypothetical protein
MGTGSVSSPADTARDWARSGVLPLTGHRSGPPLLPPGNAASWAARMADHIAEATRGSRHPVRIDGSRLLAERAALTGGTRQGAVSVAGSCRLLRTLDGWAAVSVARPDDPALWSALIGHELDDRFPERLASWLAEHTGDELDERAELLGLAGAAVRPRPKVSGEPLRLGRPRSADGLLVVDFSALWAGPLCAHLLGLAGAEVVKVETPDRPDGTRRGNPAFFDLLHGGHRSVVLDPADPAGRAALHALVRRADIVIEASRPRALARFGLDAEAEAERGCVWVSITAAGRSSQRVGFGDDVAAGAGLLARDDQGLPVFCGDAIADPLTGLTAAALALSEPEDGTGKLWDVSMSDVVTATLADTVDDAAVLEHSPDGWVLDTGHEHFEVEPPVARAPSSSASTMGADTSAVLAHLGIASA